MKLVIAKSVKHDYTSVWEEGHIPDGFILLSKVLEVEFEMLTDSDQVNAEVESLRVLVKDTLAEAQIKVNAIGDRIQSLLAIECGGGE